MADLTAHVADRSQAIRIRRARRSDFDAIRTLHRRTFDEHVAREPDFDMTAPFIERLLADLSRPFGVVFGVFAKERAAVLVAEVGGAVAGHIAYTRHSNALGPYAALVNDISVDPALRRTGLGRRLVAAMERREARAGVTSFAATVWPRNRAGRRLFDTLGYAPLEGGTAGGEPHTLLHKSVEFARLPFLVSLLKSAALTLLAIAVAYRLGAVLFG